MILIYLNPYFCWTSVGQKLSHVWQGGGRPNVGSYANEERFLDLSNSIHIIWPERTISERRGVGASGEQ